jgi:hypothetical protein
MKLNESTPPIRPPDGIRWHSIPVRHLYIEDELRGYIGLSFPKVNGVLPFIRLPWVLSLDIVAKCEFSRINEALEECKKLRRIALSCSDQKCVFTDYGKQVTYACVGPQPSRNSKTGHNNPPFMSSLPQHHWRSLVWVMKCADRSFCTFTDHSPISHLHQAKKLIPFKTFSPSTGDNLSTFSADFSVGIAFGTNVFLCCHTDEDFTMSISQVVLKGRCKYSLEDKVVAYFCFPTLGVAIPLWPGNNLMFNALVPHCISSRSKLEDEIMCASVYLKTAIVGMNNNDIPLTSNQSLLADRLHSSKTK